MENWRFHKNSEINWFFNDIFEHLLEEFGIDEKEAIGRINKRFSNQDLSEDREYLFHDTPKDWAFFIYYGKDSQWWKNKNDLKPLPYT